jgi:hypothetical protein
MISSPLRARFESVLRDQHLADDLSAFADPAYFDEAPLYSQYRQVDFLEQDGEFNLMVIELSLDYLDRVVSAMRGDQFTRFAAITVISDDEGKHLVPQIFVCNGDVKRRLAALRLSLPASNLGREVGQLVRQARPDGFTVLEDRITVPGDVRVFVGHESPPQGFFALEELISVPSEGEAPNASVPSDELIGTRDTCWTVVPSDGTMTPDRHREFFQLMTEWGLPQAVDRISGGDGRITLSPNAFRLIVLSEWQSARQFADELANRTCSSWSVVETRCDG